MATSQTPPTQPTLPLATVPRPVLRWVRPVVVVVVLTGLAAAGFWWPRGEDSDDPQGVQLTHTVRRGDLLVSVTEQGTLESSENTEIKCRVRGQNTVIWVIEGGAWVEPGYELVRLDTLEIEEAIAERKKYAHWSRSAAERSKADVARSRLAISEYEEGRFVAELATLEKDLAIAQSNLRTAQNMLDYVTSLHSRGYRSALDLEDARFAVRQAELDVEVKDTEITVLKDYTRREQMETLEGNLRATEARFKADDERAYADASRRDRALVELDQCVIKAPRAGLVIYPSAAAWKDAPDIAEGATVHKDQILLLMPDLTKMQVKVGIHESMIDRITPGLEARVTLPDRRLDAEVTSVASVTTPGGWWNGNVVKYDTIISLPAVEGLKPGMSAEVEVIMATHQDVLLLPVAAVVETEKGTFCWVTTASGVEKRPLSIGDSNEIFVVVESGVQEGDDVVLNPLAYIEEAQLEVLRPSDQQSAREPGRAQDETPASDDSPDSV